jgi:hypothetical protein
MVAEAEGRVGSRLIGAMVAASSVDVRVVGAVLMSFRRRESRGMR